MPHDRTLINHELYEMELKSRNPGMPHDEAHALAAQKYNYQSESEAYYAEVRKRNKRRKQNHS